MVLSPAKGKYCLGHSLRDNGQSLVPEPPERITGIILDIVQNIEFKEVGQKTQVYHYSNAGETSWYDFAKEIFKIAEIGCKVNPITTQQYPTPAQRPKNTLMNKAKIAKTFSVGISDWKYSLNACI